MGDYGLNNRFVPVTKPSREPFPDRVAFKIDLPAKPASLWNVRPGGMLAERMQLALSRLTAPPYSLNLPNNPGWVGPANVPGDIPGRWLNALCLYSQVLGRMPKEVYDCGSRLKEALNSYGYVGPRCDGPKEDENCLSGNGMMLYGCLAWTETTADPAGLETARSIVDNLLWPKRNVLFRYLDESVWRVRASEVGCAGLLIRPVTELCRVTGKKEYLALSEGIAKTWMGWDYPTDFAHAHANLQVLIGLVTLYLLTGNRAYFDAVLDAVKTYIRHQTPYRGISNRVGPEGFFTDANWKGGFPLFPGRPDGKDHKDTLKVLALDARHTETCAMTDWLELNCLLWTIAQDTAYLDRAERILYNGLMASQEPAGSWGCLYFQPAHTHNEMAVKDVVWCCNMWGARGYAHALRYAYAVIDGSALINFYLPGIINLDVGGGRLRFEIDTAYPDSGKVKISVLECPRAMKSMYFRIPAWSEIEGLEWAWKKDDLGTKGLAKVFDKEGYVGLKGEFAADLVIYLELAMPIRMENGQFGYVEEPVVKELRNDSTFCPDASLFKGPCQLVLEGQDNKTKFGEGKFVLSVDQKRDGSICLAKVPPESQPGFCWPELHREVRTVQPREQTGHLSPIAELTRRDEPRAKGTFDIVVNRAD